MKLELTNVSQIHDSKEQIYNIFDANFSIMEKQKIAILSTQKRSTTSLLRLISGSHRPTRGVIKREGLFTGPIGGKIPFHPELSLEENIRFMSRIYGQNYNQLIKDIQQFSRLGKELKLKTKKCPASTKRKVIISTQLMIRADVYQLARGIKEPEYWFQRNILRRLDEIMKQSTLVVTSESTKILEKYTDTAIVIDKKGRLQVFNDLQSGINTLKALKENT